MLNRHVFILPLLLCSLCSFAQIELGLKAGLSTESLQGEQFGIDRDGRDDLMLALQDADYGFQFGALLRLPLGEKLTLQPEVTFNSAKNNYTFSDGAPEPTQVVFEERYNDLNVPVLLSYKVAFLRLHAGPVGHFFLSETSDLGSQYGLERTFETFNLGYALGGSVDIGPLTVDVRYDGNFAKYGETFTWQGDEYRMDQAPKRWIGSVAYRF
ncbi:outer membrane beta-barrel protein [Lewinella sp. JB7]|uniref:outer membrane beta-barrel protein n=1 Tax=Lewinella sp. JB7 TaxID=2962887 RepID=UPI0020C9EE70|nr:outer membrane beta-barrel protein [Lewinella sp. JB7]MCP9236073.1 PorT family protein [Lewinella sp. JB7]